MRWFFFAQSEGRSAADQLLYAIGSMLDCFKEDMGDRALVVSGHWVNGDQDMYEIEIGDALLASEFDAWLDNNPEYDTYRESPEVAALG